jgi:putative membrane protein
MIRILRTVLALLGLLVIVTFAIANRTPVEISLAPLPILIELPVYGVFLLGLVLGGLIGGLVVWLGGVGQRRQARRTRKKVRALENQMATVKEQEQSARAMDYSTQRAMLAQGTRS